MPTFPSGLSLILEATAPRGPAPARTPTLHFHERPGAARGVQPLQRMANAEPVAACSSTRPIPVPQWDSQAFDTQLDYVRNAGDYSAVSEQNGYAPLSVEYEALHDAARQGALAAVRNGMRCPDAAARFNIASNPEDVETLMLFAATQLGRTQVQNGEPLSCVLDNLGIRPDSLAGQILKNAL